MKRLMIFAAALSLLLTTPVLSTPDEAPQDAAQIVLNAPSTARVGELVRLDASDSSADSFKWLLVPESVDFEVYAEGRKAVFSAREKGEYLFIVAVAKGSTVDVKTWVLHVIGPPDEPVEGANIADFVVFWLWPMQVPQEQKLALADNFDRISGLNLVDAREWVYETQKSNREVLGDAISVWEPFLRQLGAKLEQLATEGNLTTPEQHAQVWKDIANGLRKG
jgi:hypothetical protein